MAIFAKARAKPKKEVKEHGIPFTKTAASVAGVDIAIPGTTGGIRLLGFTARNVYEYIAALLTYSAAAVLLTVKYAFPKYAYFNMNGIDIGTIVQASSSQLIEDRP
ncbi:MAG: tight adherence protein [Clostridiales bacterium]|nr:tight adherence protein [Clostridiales bacterium]